MRSAPRLSPRAKVIKLADKIWNLRVFDDDQGVVPALIGERLGMPVVTVAREIVLEGEALRVVRATPDGDEIVRVGCPAVVTITNELGDPRYPTAAAKMKAKLGVTMRPYRILGACNPPFAHKALQHSLDVGMLMPCNVIVYETDEGQTRVSAVDPMQTMAAQGDAEMAPLAEAVQQKLQRVIDSL